jgi:DNA-binding TFAR19-related protein (PDSD5 family)
LTYFPRFSLPEHGERLTRDAYKRDFRARETALRDASSRKLERRQHFEEQGNPSRDALRRGEWETALRLLEDRRDALLATAQEDARKGYRFHRVRVVEKPLPPYVRWELHSLRQRAEYGERIRVVSGGQVAAAERERPLPEVVVLGRETLYQVLYSEAGTTLGAVRYTDHDLVRSWEHYIRKLYEAGEDVRSYFEREVAHLPPPTE